jgi:O-acetylhomoserine (thiol)-lyase
MGFSTDIIHTSFTKEDVHGATLMPIYSNATFSFSTSEEMELAFQGRIPSHTYSRISNPTVENLEQRVRKVTGALAVTAVSSGMAAIANTILTIAESGDNIVTSKHLFGNTYSLFSTTFHSYHIGVKFCALTDRESIENAIDENTIAIFFETITNPQLEVSDIQQLSHIARQHKLLLIADSTLTPPNIFRAADWGVHLEVISGTKIISGGATSLGGLIVDYGTYDWSDNKKIQPLATGYGPFAFNYKLRKEVHRNFGATLSPFPAYLQSLGMETLELRFNKAADNCMRIATFLENEDKVQSVNYPGLKSSRFYEVAVKQFGLYPGTVLTFTLSSKELCFSLINRLKVICRATNIYDNRTLIIHPASTIYCDFTKSVRESVGVPDTLIRLSVGIEDAEDLITDLSTALNN